MALYKSVYKYKYNKFATESVTRGQCGSWPTVTFPAAEHIYSLASTSLYM